MSSKQQFVRKFRRDRFSHAWVADVGSQSEYVQEAVLQRIQPARRRKVARAALEQYAMEQNHKTMVAALEGMSRMFIAEDSYMKKKRDEEAAARALEREKFRWWNPLTW